jgi:hypothetical protein
MTEPVVSSKDTVAQARLARDRELGLEAAPPFTLSDVRRRQRRAAPYMLLILAAWVVGLFAVIIWVRPLMVTRTDWYGVLILLYFFPSIAAFHYAMLRVQRRSGLRCPYCGTTFVHLDIKNYRNQSTRPVEDLRRCGRCQAVIIDMES